MESIIIVISMVAAGFGLGKYITFSRAEGTDERGKFILANASHVTMSFLFIIFAVLVLIVGFMNISAEVLGVVVVATLSLLIIINALSIMYYSKRI